MPTNNDQDIKQLLRPDVGTEDVRTEDGGSPLARALKRARANVAQRDTLAFAIVRMWTALAALLAPLFAAFAKSHAQALHGRRPPRNNPIDQDS